MKRSVLFIIIAIVLYSCKKHATELPTCGGRLLGYQVLSDASSGGNAQLGEISLKTNTNTSMARFASTPYTSQGVYCNDLSYYAFDCKPFGNTFVLQQAHVTGAVKRLTFNGQIASLDGLVYSKNLDKLYCFEHYYSAGNVGISEIKISGNTFTLRRLNGTNGVLNSTSHLSSTIDDNNGTIYFAVNRDSAFSLMKFTIKDSSLTSLVTVRNANILGLQFSPADSMLYALRSSCITPWSKSELVKITPKGAIVSFGTLPFNVNASAYSTSFDACNKNYIISSLVDTQCSILSIAGLNGKMIKHDTVKGMFQGLYTSL